VGQLVAEAIKLYRRRFWASLALGLSVAALDQVLSGTSRLAWLVLTPTLGGLVLSISYAGASALAAGTRPDRSRILTALAVGVIAFAPFPLLVLGFILPGLAWLAFVGLAVPAAVIEGTGFRESFRRGVSLARADYVHALGSLATLAITFFLTRLVLVFLLRGQGEATDRVAAFLGDLVLSPLLFLGAALLYYDQAARVVDSSPRPRRSRDADLRPALESDRPGRSDPEVESRPAARGQP
jgi:hypothetical protein